MRKNYIQSGELGNDDRMHIDGDWYSGGIPSNTTFANNVYIDTSYGFAGFNSMEPNALIVGEASGCYDRSSFIVGKWGKIEVGKYCILNGATIICKDQITIGNHCMLAWGCVLTDSWIDTGMLSIVARRMLLKKSAEDESRLYPFFEDSSPVVLEDNCWVGFDSVVLPGVRLGKGCVVGCKTIVDKDVPPYAIVTGNPAKIIRYLHPNDMEEERATVLKTV